MHEAFIREDIDKLNVLKSTLKGELTVVISERNNVLKVVDEKKIVNKAKKYLKNYSLKDTVEINFRNRKS